MKTVLFVPGFRAETSLKRYKARKAVESIKTAGYITKFVPIHWNYKTISNWTEELKKVYKNYDPTHTILAGFSFGSMTALKMAAEKMPSELWLFSLSPYFAEDIPFLKDTYLNDIGKYRTEEFKQLSFDELAAKITCPVKLFAGSKEMDRYPDIRRRAEDAAKKFQNCTYVVVEGAGHEIEHPNYMAEIKRNI